MQLETAFAVYRVGAQLGQGGAGYVYEVQTDDGDVFAAKVIDPDRASRSNRKRFKNEISFLSRNKHPNIITVFDHGLSDEGAPFFVMPRLTGSLRDAIVQLAGDRVLRVFNQVLDGVEAAHRFGVVHRDLKPENILVDPADDRVLVCDFGIARFIADDVYTAVETKDSDRLANFAYAAPEQRVKGGTVSEVTDIYALGLILNEMFTGSVPLGVNYTQISDIEPEFAYLDDIVQKMLQNDPSRRYSAIEELKAELIGRKADFVSLQKLSRLRDKVIPLTEVDDPLVDDPVSVTDAAWADGVMTITLSRSVNQDWVTCLGREATTAVFGYGPEVFSFHDNLARVPVPGDSAPRVLEYFKGWVPKANLCYKSRRVQEAVEIERRARKRHEEMIAAEIRSREVNEKLHI